MQAKQAGGAPETSIVIRTFNEEKHIGNLLATIQRQNYTDYEVIIVDSGSTDRTLEIAKQFPVTIVPIESRDFTFGYSLNTGCQASRGAYLIFASAHVLPVDADWLENMIAPFADTEVGMAYGRQVGSAETKFSEKQDFRHFFGTSPTNTAMFLEYANNANSAIRKSLWDQRPFDEYLFGLEDIEWARHITSNGYTVRYEPKAAVYHIHEETWSQVFNRYRREAIAAFRIGIPFPPQARIAFFWLCRRLIEDVLASFPDWSPARIEEILRFRYYQWKGTRQGWFNDRQLDFDREKYSLFYPPANKAVVIKGRQHAVLDEIPIPEMKPGDILVRVAYAGVCQTDIEVYEGTLGYYREGAARYPIVPGHEFSGTIIKIGASNKYREQFAVGQAVVGECILSRHAEHRAEVGVINHDGAYAQYVVIPGAFLHPVPEGMDLKTAAITEPLAVVLRGLRRLGELPGSASVAVIGAGPIGNLCAQVLAGRGHRVTVFDSAEARLAYVAGIADRTSATLADLSAFDALIEATGSQSVLERVLAESRMDSKILLLGFPYGTGPYNFEDVVAQEKTIIGSAGSEGRDFVAALQLLPALDTAHFTETVLPLSEFKEAWTHRKDHLKILLMPPFADTQG